MDELKTFLNQNPTNYSDMVVFYYEAVKAMEKFKSESISTLMISQTPLTRDCFIITTNYILIVNSRNQYSNVILELKLQDIINVYFLAEDLPFSLNKVKIQTRSQSKPILIRQFEKEQLIAIERLILFAKGSSDKIISEPKTDISNTPQIISTEVNNEEDISLKLKKLKNLFENELITKDEYELKKKDLLSNF